ncbi:hypothetical protein NC653_037781 [Populus alba x Populus x berolinensis]|uniref:Uncharacterized protein n=1 Tax=Populus alba x Populus x berolinensis TaxID=444605 RepID=A0AAD6LFA5_9ROSI|nr:hypothetical protein NC653_037781 [Populus alba x Populus x berolinensis]
MPEKIPKLPSRNHFRKFFSRLPLRCLVRFQRSPGKLAISGSSEDVAVLTDLVMMVKLDDYKIVKRFHQQQENGGSKKRVNGFFFPFDLSEEKFLEMTPLRGLTEDDSSWTWELKEYSSEPSWTSFLRFNAISIPGGKYVGFELFMGDKEYGNVFYEFRWKGSCLSITPDEDTARPSSSCLAMTEIGLKSTAYIESLVSPNNISDGLLPNKSNLKLVVPCFCIWYLKNVLAVWQ